MDLSKAQTLKKALREAKAKSMARAKVKAKTKARAETEINTRTGVAHENFVHLTTITVPVMPTDPIVASRGTLTVGISSFAPNRTPTPTEAPLSLKETVPLLLVVSIPPVPGHGKVVKLFSYSNSLEHLR